MLRCSDGSYYVGLSSNLDQRIQEHQTGVFPGSYTSRRLPVTLVYSAEFREVYDAISWERRIKRWSRRRKEALIRGDSNALHILSFRQTLHSPYSIIREKIRKKIKKNSPRML